MKKLISRLIISSNIIEKKILITVFLIFISFLLIGKPLSIREKKFFSSQIGQLLPDNPIVEMNFNPANDSVSFRISTKELFCPPMKFNMTAFDSFKRVVFSIPIFIKQKNIFEKSYNYNELFKSDTIPSNKMREEFMRLILI
jgi:hypothetical protein